MSDDLQRIFHELTRLDEAERRHAMEKIRQENPAMADELASLLDFHPTSSEPEDPENPDSSLHLPNIPGFVTTERIDHGGMGVVYKGRQDRPQREVAIKVLRSLLLEPKARRRFLSEAEVLATLHHPGIVTVYAMGLEDAHGNPLPWIAMELVPEARSITTAARMDNWSPEQCLRAVATAAEAIHHAHLNGVIHRDVKPQNILVDSTNQIRVIDFGIAKMVNEDHDMTMTQDGSVIGTLKYMSPEQISGQTMDARSDVHALGTILYECLAGHSPYGTDASPAEVIRRIESGQIDSINISHRSNQDIDAVIRTAMATNPEDRYESMQAFARDCRAAANAEPILARSPSNLELITRLARRNPLVTSLLAILVFVITGGIIVNSILAYQVSDSNRDARRRAYLASLHLVEAALNLQNKSDARTALDQVPIEDRGFEHLALQQEAARDARLMFDPSLRNANPYRLRAVPQTDQLLAIHDQAIHIFPRVGGLGFVTQFPLMNDGEANLQSEMIRHENETYLAIGSNQGRVHVHRMLLDAEAETLELDMIDILEPVENRIGPPVMFVPGTDLLINPIGLGRISIHRASIAGDQGTEINLPGLNVITALACSSDGRFFFAGDETGTIFQVNIEHPESLVALPGLGSRINSMAVNADGTHLIAGGQNRSAMLIDLHDQSFNLLPGHRGMIWDVAFSPDGSQAATCSFDRSVRIWDVTTGNCTEIRDDPNRIAWSMVWNELGLTVSTEAGEILIWDNQTDNTDVERRILAANIDSKMMFTTDLENSKYELVSDTGEVQVLSGLDEPLFRSTCGGLEFPGRVAVLTVSGRIMVSNPATGHFQELTSDIAPETHLMLSNDASLLACVNSWYDTSIYRVDEEIGDTPAEPVYAIDLGPTNGQSVAQDPKGGFLLGSTTGDLFRIDQSDMVANSILKAPTWVHAMEALLDGGMATGDHRGFIYRFDEEGTMLWESELPWTAIRQLAQHPNEMRLATLSANGDVHVLDLEDGTVLCRLGEVPGMPAGLEFNAEGTELLAWSREGFTKRWHTQPRKKTIVPTEASVPDETFK